MNMDGVLGKEIISQKSVCRIAGVALFMFLTALGAFVRIPLPFTPVPLTLQTFFVCLSGAVLGAGLGIASQLGYVALGILGVPLFSGAGSGLLYLSGPTAGYLIGFLPASFLTASMLRRSRGTLGAAFLVFCCADAVILGCGMLWIKFLFGYSLTQAVLTGIVPFIPGDLVKAFLGVLVYRRLRSRVREIF